MTEAQQAAARKLEALGAERQEDVTDIVVYWLNNHCFLVTEDGEIDEL